MGQFDMSYLAVMLDMAGCPNRCRHCWLGDKRNGHMSVDEFRNIAAEFRNWRDEEGNQIAEMGFFSWWREPDYRDDYRELWALEQELSSPGRAQRFELLSTWRLARDADYARWAATLPPQVCQISFFGMEESTDWGMRRRGAFRDQLEATRRCQAVGITPRWQLFLTRRCLPELGAFLDLLQEYDISSFFIGGISPEGCGFELEDERMEAADLALIPEELILLSRDGLELLGRPESELLPELLSEHAAPQISVPVPSLAVDADYNVYPNIAEPAEWWRLGNLRSDGVDAVMRAYRDGTTPGMIANRTIPVSELARRYGNPDSTKLYDRDDLICRFMHQWGMEHDTRDAL
ncbi:MAG: radical SAM protein [Bacillota bacterium]|nr:radical SAM protein [Bacillota bacterium]